MAFSYEREKQFTGKVQYRIDGASAVTAGGRSWKRGEVKAIPRSIYADGLVAGGNFAHVPADTPEGVPGDDLEHGTEDAPPATSTSATIIEEIEE